MKKGIFKVLIIGAGRIGATFDTPKSGAVLSHAHAFSGHPGFALVGFVDADFIAARRAAKLWGGQAFVSVAEAFKDQTIDVVVNATPDSAHHKVLKQVLAYPVKLVFAEKPLTKTPEQALEIVKLARRRRINVAVNYNRRFLPEFRRLAADIKRGQYGRYLTGTGYYGKGTKHNGSHLLDCLRFLVGEVKSSRIVNRDYDFTADDPSVSAVLGLANGQPFFLQHLSRKFYTIFELDLLFESARVRVIDAGRKITIQTVKADVVFGGYEVLGPAKTVETLLDKSFYFMADNVYRYLAKRASLACPLDEGYKTLLTAALVLGGKK